MRIDHLNLTNFRGFAERELAFHPEFNLVVGENGSGKTSVLEAAAVAAGGWLHGLRGDYDSREIREGDVRLVAVEIGDEVRWEQQIPCTLETRVTVGGQRSSWRTSRGGGRWDLDLDIDSEIEVPALAAEADQAVRSGETVTLPLISYYSTGRLWNVPREQAQVRNADKIKGKEARSRLEAYRHSFDSRVSVRDLVEWIARESWRAFQRRGEISEIFNVVRDALVQNVEGARDVYFDAEYGEVIVRFDDGERQPFNNLSDGQRCMLALVGDLARKAATLNPHLRSDVLAKTPGVVLIDELDLHLHPKWQRRVIEDLRTTFPSLQFICTTHSPFLIQSLRSGEELVMLDGQPTANLADMPLEEIARGIQGVEQPEVSARYEEMREVAKNYLETLEEAARAPEDKLEEYEQQLAHSIAPYADNPAFQAFLEMKRVARLGE